VLAEMRVFGFLLALTGFLGSGVFALLDVVSSVVTGNRKNPECQEQPGKIVH
jgi:hypothetical protein